MLGDPEGHVRVWPLPDQEPVEFPYSKSVRASWITEELIRQLLEEGPN